MASSTTDPDRIKPSVSSNPCQKVRIVAKVRGFTDKESESLNKDSPPWISVHKPNGDGSSEKVSISFGEQSTRDVCEMDYCYEQNEDNGMIFLKEIKPLISRVFDGQNVAIIAYGARGSGKSYTIQGREDKQGLAALTIAEILSMVEGAENSVAVSLYEVFQDRVYDLLDPTRPEVQVLEDAQGNIKLKGLSQGFVKSVSEFQKLYSTGCGLRRAMQKIPFEQPRRSHKGLIIRILSNNESLKPKLLGKINFVDLAGYEDARRKSCDGLNLVESTRINKSLYALLNVVHALNGNESHVPYRESKLTRMLQDSFGGTSHVLMLTCLNPLYCQDTIYATSLASRSCQGVNRVFPNSLKKTKGSTKQMVLSSSTKGKLGNGSSTVKKSTSKAYFSEKKTICLGTGSKLFDEGNHSSSSEQEKPISDAFSLTVSVKKEKPISDAFSLTVSEKEEKLISDVSSATQPKNEEKSISDVFSVIEPKNEDVSRNSERSQSRVTADFDNNIKALTYLEEDGDNLEKENTSLLMNETGSPPLSARLRELSNNWRSLYSSTPLQIKIPHETDPPSSDQVVFSDIMEPKTPVIEQDLSIKDKWEVARVNSPVETFSARSSGLKHSLVQDYLKFLNSASKEQLKGLRGIGEKRATYILELREESPEPFKDLDDLKDIGLSAKQIKGMMKKVAGELFS